MAFGSYSFSSVAFGDDGLMVVLSINKKIQLALFDRLSTLSLSPALPISWPNVDFTPGVKGYLRATFHPNRNRRLFMNGADDHYRQGVLMVSVFKPLNEGPTKAEEVADKIAEHFPADLELTSSDVKVKISSAPDVSSAFADGPFWHVPVEIPYHCFA